MRGDRADTARDAVKEGEKNRPMQGQAAPGDSDWMVSGVHLHAGG